MFIVNAASPANRASVMMWGGVLRSKSTDLGLDAMIGLYARGRHLSTERAGAEREFRANAC